MLVLIRSTYIPWPNFISFEINLSLSLSLSIFSNGSIVSFIISVTLSLSLTTVDHSRQAAVCSADHRCKLCSCMFSASQHMAILQGYDCDNRFVPPKIENSRVGEEYREKELKESIVATQKRFKFIHKEELRLESLADGVFNSFVTTQVTIFQTSTIAIFSLMIGQEIACSIVALVVALMFGLFFGLLFPLFVIYYKLNRLNIWVTHIDLHKLNRLHIWVTHIDLHKNEVNTEAALVISQYAELLSSYSQRDSPSEDEPPQLPPNEDEPPQLPPNEDEIDVVPQPPQLPANVPPQLPANVPQPPLPANGRPHSLLGEHIASLIRMKEEGVHMVRYKKLYGRLLTISFASAVLYMLVLPIILGFSNKSCQESWKKNVHSYSLSLLF